MVNYTVKLAFLVLSGDIQPRIEVQGSVCVYWSTDRSDFRASSRVVSHVRLSVNAKEAGSDL